MTTPRLRALLTLLQGVLEDLAALDQPKPQLPQVNPDLRRRVLDEDDMWTTRRVEVPVTWILDRRDR
jgi:hypothetical protein